MLVIAPIRKTSQRPDARHMLVLAIFLPLLDSAIQEGLIEEF